MNTTQRQVDDDTSSGSLAGKVAVITGGSRGIGQACAALFASEGADIVVGDLQDSQQTRALVEAAGRHYLHVPTDTSAEGDCDELAVKAVAAFGGIDVGVACAGIGEWTAPLADLPIADFRRVIDVNVIGVMATGRALAREMIKQQRPGSIINLASAAARVPVPGLAAYCTSKASVWMLTKVMALELVSHRIRVNAVGPSFIPTAMTTRLTENEDALAKVVSANPMGRLGTTQEVAEACLFLAGSQSSYITGQILHPTGGLFVG
jgi:NAD(P)-dependent dehydrogenase (short-subunit alcohol dehydrogenase family)